VAGDWLVKEGQRVTVLSAKAFKIHYERYSPEEADEKGSP